MGSPGIPLTQPTEALSKSDAASSYQSPAFVLFKQMHF